jgi:hypothetical protein
MVEDMGPANAINLRLYVEDLAGGGHHADIYTSTIVKGSSGFTEWPMGWHQGHLVLSVVPACSVTPVTSPDQWHMVDASTAHRLAATPGTNIGCPTALWPSPAGTVCWGMGAAYVFDWNGNSVWRGQACCGSGPAALSPAGRSVMLPGLPQRGYPGETDAFNWGETGVMHVAGNGACFWISDSSLLAPDAVIAYPSGSVTMLPAAGICAGRFPGAL